MPIFLSVVVFLFLVLTIAALGMKFWVRPKEAMERVSGAVLSPSDSAPNHPSLALAELLKKWGTLLPANPKDVTTMQRRLIRAGYRNENALKILYGAKVFFAVTLPLLATLAVANSASDPANKFLFDLAAVALGFSGPHAWGKIQA